MKIGTLLFSLFIFFGCKHDAKPQIAKETVSQGILSAADIADLVQKVDYVDFLFFHMNISVSQNDLSSIHQSVGFLTPSGKSTSMRCDPIGRMSLQSNGKIILEADMHLAENCGYFTIIENKVGKGTSLMSSDGVKFLTALVNGYKTK